MARALTQVEAERVLPRQRVLIDERLGAAAAPVGQHPQSVPTGALLGRQRVDDLVQRRKHCRQRVGRQACQLGFGSCGPPLRWQCRPSSSSACSATIKASCQQHGLLTADVKPRGWVSQHHASKYGTGQGPVWALNYNPPMCLRPSPPTHPCPPG